MRGIAARSIALCVTALAVCSGAYAGGQGSAAAEQAPLFRVILNDGTALVSYGEFAHVGDRVIFSMPLAGARSSRFQMMNLPASTVNWEATTRYAEAARYAQYVSTRAETDFAMLTGEIARVLNEINLTSDPARRLQLAEQARRLLVGWPADHYGYRSAEVRDMSTLLDETISQIRASAGINQFDFNLVAMFEPPVMPLLPDPTLAQSIEQSMIAARVSDVPAERISLLTAVLSIIDESSAALPKDWAKRARAAAKATLDAELDVSKKYASLGKRAVRAASAAAEDGDVRGVERAIESAQRRDKRLGQRREEEMQALMAALKERLDSARRLRLMRDQWSRRSAVFADYKAAISQPVELLDRLRGRLEDIRALAGPPVGALPGMIQRFERAYRLLRLVRPPDELAAAHATLLSAADLGQQAARTRERATMTGDVKVAWDASAAAAGSLMMFAQGRQQIEVASRPPELR